MLNEKDQKWLEDFYVEIERLFDGRLPRTFDIEMIQVSSDMSAEEAAKDYFVGYHSLK